MAKFSIIVPVYNVEKYVDQCICSLFAQTETDIEIIAIDDGSTDESGLVLDRLAKKDRRLRVYHKNNEGVSASRNLGLDLARGEFITFVDSDDWCDPTMLEEAYSFFLEHKKCEIVVFSLDTDKKKPLGKNTKLLPFGSGNVTDYREFIELRSISKYYSDKSGKPGSISVGGACAKLVRRSLIDRLHHRFNTTLIRAQDTVFWIELFENAQEIYYLDKAMYHYRRWLGSVTYGARYIPDSTQVFDEILREYSRFIAKYNKDERFINALYLRATDIILWNLKHNFANSNNPDSLKKRKQELANLVNSEPYHKAIRSVSVREFRFLVLILKMHLYRLCIIMYEFRTWQKERGNLKT
ncbi:MAG: glycosyltransferase [Lachnospiraceae bacterium]|nr:glycosyltransferase [Lachnospiraceae bacterium]